MREATNQCFPQGTDSCVIFVDDDRSVARAVGNLLQCLGFCVRTMHDPAEALAIFKAGRSFVAALVTDLQMPGMSGLELAAAARALQPTLPVVLCSGSLTDEDRVKAKALGIARC